MAPETSLALAQNLLGGANDNVWTVLTAPNADALADSVACLVDPRVSRQIAGQVSLLDISKAKIDSIPVSNTHFVITQPLSVGNARLIAAGWLSLHALYYVGAALVIGLLLALATRLFVKNVGRRTP
jgi:cellulose synthase operon protein B